ncbi:23S rRNA (adenine(2503)-C(2))-methyltransferase RlmN [Candidatus Sumerlaeota bacterium]|nr:23S rRNA (adenine(2503)-C(2))-methyltransferase RlmN [Candidatus Sumerlaeota bacterium]
MKKDPPTRASRPTGPAASSRPRLRAMTLQDMTAFMQRAGHRAFRARQLFQWVYEKGARDFDDMTNLAASMREWLASEFELGGMKRYDIVGPSGETQKLVFETDDGEYVESVLMRDEPDDSDDPDPPSRSSSSSSSFILHPSSFPPPPSSTPPSRKVSLCVSSQVGCPLGCTFCMTGHGGYRRNLRTDEIIDQILTARRSIESDERISNLVFMGMGEPMLNLAAVLPALRLIVSPQALGFATRRVTVSTAGLVDGIDELGRSGIEVCLAVSLNATTQTVRDRLMPKCRKWPIKAVLDACRRYPLTKRRRITFEYVLLGGVNDTWDDAKRLARLLRGIPCKINLILYNPADPLPHRPTAEARAEAFRARLADADYTASLRRSKGRSYHAACGQLAGHMRKRTHRPEEDGI